MNDLPRWLQYLKENCDSHRVPFVLVKESASVNNLLLECVKHSVAVERLNYISNLAEDFVGITSEAYDISNRYIHLHRKMLLHDDDKWTELARKSWNHISKKSTVKTSISNYLIMSCIYSHYSNEESIKSLVNAEKVIDNNSELEYLMRCRLKLEVENVNDYIRRYGEINV